MIVKSGFNEINGLDRLTSIMPHLISNEQKGFTKGRIIHDYICLASEAFNMLDRKCFGGNVAIKVNVIKFFDTLNWNFLLKVLNCFGFSSKFFGWIYTILSSTRLFMLFNGSL